MLNPGITKIVALLQANGFNTVDSGDGETHDFECDREYGYVAMTVPPEDMVEEANRLRDLLGANGIAVHITNDQEKPCIQASYDPVNGLALIDLEYVHDKMLSG